MHVFVAGAAGAIGKRLIPQLVDRGHKVTQVLDWQPSWRTWRDGFRLGLDAA